MDIEKIYPKGFAANTYILKGDNNKAIVIDPAQKGISTELRKRHLVPAYVLLTHSHFDHVGGVPELQAEGAKVYCSVEEEKLLGTSATLFELFRVEPVVYNIDKTLKDNEEINICGYTIRCILTPGHTSGSMCYIATNKYGESCMFTGDTLFYNSVGRTDFPTGNCVMLSLSLEKLSNLEGDYKIYPGHEEDTTLDYERKHNLMMISFSKNK